MKILMVIVVVWVSSILWHMMLRIRH